MDLHCNFGSLVSVVRFLSVCFFFLSWVGAWTVNFSCLTIEPLILHVHTINYKINLLRARAIERTEES